MKRLRMAVIGVGHLGKEHARILAGLADVELVGVADINADQAQAVALRCGTRAYSDYRSLVHLIDAAVVAVPTIQHHAIAAELLRRGIALLVEKPLSHSLDQAEELVTLARRHSAVLQVGHIERFNPAFEEVQRRTMQPKFVECERLGPFTGRSLDIGVVLDLMIHDLDLLLALVPAPVRSVEALGVSIFGRHEDVANARLVFANGCVANVSVSRASAVPVRRMRIWSPEGFAGLDLAKRSVTLIQPTEQLRQQGLDPRKLGALEAARLKEDLFGHYLLPLHLDCHGGDQLTRELQHFVGCVQKGERPCVSGAEGRDAVALAARILEAIRTHAWEGDPNGPMGPCQLSAPLGLLFTPHPQGAAA